MKQEVRASSEDEIKEVDSGIETTPLQFKKVKRNLMSSFRDKPGPKSANKDRREINTVVKESIEDEKVQKPLEKPEGGDVKLQGDSSTSKVPKKRTWIESEIPSKPCPASKKKCKPCPASKKPTKISVTEQNTCDYPDKANVADLERQVEQNNRQQPKTSSKTKLALFPDSRIECIVYTRALQGLKHR